MQSVSPFLRSPDGGCGRDVHIDEGAVLAAMLRGEVISGGVDETDGFLQFLTGQLCIPVPDM